MNVVKVSHSNIDRIHNRIGYDWSLTERSNGVTSVTIGHTFTKWGARHAVAKAKEES
jgi:hypothetical protein